MRDDNVMMSYVNYKRLVEIQLRAHVVNPFFGYLIMNIFKP